jgi:hypothetical protein
MVITKSEAHEIDHSGERLLREVLEAPPLGWVVNAVQRDYGIDYNVQIFDARSPTGTWFHVQLKSSASSAYSADRSFMSQELSVHHARHFALEMREPVLLIHADVESKSIYWYAPQLDTRLAKVLNNTGAKFVTLRVPTCQKLPDTAPQVLTAIDSIHLKLATRNLESASTQGFAEILKHFPDQEVLYTAFQEKFATLKFRKIAELYKQRKFHEARPRAEGIILDADSTVEIRFWAHLQLEAIDFGESLHAGKPQSELPKLILSHAKALQKLTASGPKHLKFFSLIARQAAELDILVHENGSLFMALQQHLEQGGNPMMALGLYVRRSAITRHIVSRYNRCIRLTRYATTYPDRWMLGRALTRIVIAIGTYLVTLHSEEYVEAEKAFAQSALQISKSSAWICEETGDGEGVVLAILGALATVRSTDSDAYRWASQVAQSLSDPQIRADALVLMERATKRWRGEAVEGDYNGDTAWQIIQNMASAFGIDLSDENDPLVRGLRIAARDNSPERVLACCEHIVVGQGATGPVAREIWRQFNITMAASKVVHCTLHDFHVEGKELDAAYAEFKRTHCDSCPDQKPRPEGWRYTGEEKQIIESRHYEFVKRLAGTRFGLRYTSED